MHIGYIKCYFCSKEIDINTPHDNYKIVFSEGVTYMCVDCYEFSYRKIKSHNIYCNFCNEKINEGVAYKKDQPKRYGYNLIYHLGLSSFKFSIDKNNLDKTSLMLCKSCKDKFKKGLKQEIDLNNIMEL